MMEFIIARPRTAPPARRTLVISAAKFRPQSRIGKKPIQVPEEVTVKLEGQHLVVKACFASPVHALKPIRSTARANINVQNISADHMAVIVPGIVRGEGCT
jgi:hypothetical protein